MLEQTLIGWISNQFGDDKINTCSYYKRVSTTIRKQYNLTDAPWVAQNSFAVTNDSSGGLTAPSAASAALPLPLNPVSVS
jgi:hypothetical protein